MIYFVYNKRTDQKLSHPKLGDWHTQDINEAKDLLNSLKEFVIDSGMQDLANDFVVKNFHTGEVVA